MDGSKDGITEKDSLAVRVETLFSKLTLREKIALLSGRDAWRTAAVERLGLPSLVMTDGPHGVRSTRDPGRIYGPATSFPTGIAMASSWNPELIMRVGTALAEEALAMGCDILLGPCINIVRNPLGGRTFESFGEDPYLAGRLAVAYVKGLQGRGVGASVKHFACNNQETERMRGSSVVDERTLREIYLPAFEAAVKEADPWTVMCSYNKINGVYASENRRLLREILKEEWGFAGAVVSDWGATHATAAAVEAGLDLEMPGPAKHFGELLYEAVRLGQLEEAVIDEAVRRVLRLIVLSGRLDGEAKRPSGAVNTPAHQALARELAEESIVLLKNEGGLLPLRREGLRHLAVIGPNARALLVSGGGSACLVPPYVISPWEGLAELLGDSVRLEHEEGCANHVSPIALPTTWFRPPTGEGHGLWGEYFAGAGFAGAPVFTRLDERIEFWWWKAGPDEERMDGREYAVRWRGYFAPPRGGRYRFRLEHTGICRFYLDGRLVESVQREEDPSATTFTVELNEGGRHPAVIEYIKPAAQEIGFLRVLCARVPTREEEDKEIASAAALAALADAAVVCVGMPPGYETEGADRPDLDLPGRQGDLIRAVAAANPRTVVVVNAGAPVTMPWIEQVPAVLYALYPGQEGGRAIARILLGEVNPSGRLPVTFPRRLEDTPAFLDCLGGLEVRYGEGIFVGYRYYDRRDIVPLFPFGHGLSYTTFAYDELSAPRQARIGETVRLSVRVTNTGPRAGKEVVQVYGHDVESSLPRPPKELKAFAKVALAPGESKTVEFALDERAFAFYHPHRGGWTVEPGEFELLVGSSSRDIRAEATLELVP
ncbi:MAG: hypothetical protein GX493_11930 [Firmicutes bacterium]|nr:hypothetical protein [Bacillota bacterium]